MNVHWCANETEQGLFFTVNGHFEMGGTLTKYDVKSNIISSIALAPQISKTSKKTSQQIYQTWTRTLLCTNGPKS